MICSIWAQPFALDCLSSGYCLTKITTMILKGFVSRLNAWHSKLQIWLTQMSLSTGSMLLIGLCGLGQDFNFQMVPSIKWFLPKDQQNRPVVLLTWASIQRWIRLGHPFMASNFVGIWLSHHAISYCSLHVSESMGGSLFKGRLTCWMQHMIWWGQQCKKFLIFTSLSSFSICLSSESLEGGVYGRRATPVSASSCQVENVLCYGKFCGSDWG